MMKPNQTWVVFFLNIFNFYYLELNTSSSYGRFLEIN